MRKAIMIVTLAGIFAGIAMAAFGQDKEKKHTTSSGLEYTDHVVGTGDLAKNGMTVTVNYTGWLYIKGKRDKQFDSSVGKAPFTFKLGNGEVIKGWDEGVEGMKVGGKRELVIPASIGYGSRGAGNVIPPNSTLNFEVELLKVSK